MKFRAPFLVGLALLASMAAADPRPFADVLSFAKHQVELKPNDAATRFALARVYSIGYVDASKDIDVTINESDGTLTFPDSLSVQVKHAEGSLSAVEKTYLKEAITNYNRATRYDSGSALYALGYASLFEQLAWRYQEVLGSSSFGAFENEQDVWGKVAAELRRASYIAKDKDLKHPGLTGPDSYVSRSAAQSLLRLGKAGKARLTDAEIKRLQTQIDRVNKIAGG